MGSVNNSQERRQYRLKTAPPKTQQRALGSAQLLRSQSSQDFQQLLPLLCTSVLSSRVHAPEGADFTWVQLFCGGCNPFPFYLTYCSTAPGGDSSTGTEQDLHGTPTPPAHGLQVRAVSVMSTSRKTHFSARAV